jgi:hypothetical protein
VSFLLHDGTKLALTGTDSGTQLRFFHGSIWQRFVHSVVNTNLPYKWRGSESVWSSRYTNGSIGLLFTRKAADGFLPVAWNGSGHLVLFDEKGTEQSAVVGSVCFYSDNASNQTKVVAEEILWEIPLSGQKELRLRLYETNSLTKEVLTNDFVLKNPAK